MVIEESSLNDKGVGVDRFGNQVIDPTRNVLDLVRAESKYQDGMREWLAKYDSAMLSAESKRLDDLADLRKQYDNQISENLRVQVKTTSELISTQLDKVTTSLSAQITSAVSAFTNQLSNLSMTLGARISDLERFRWEVGGKTSVSDPATSEALTNLTKMRGEIIGYLFGGLGITVAIVSAVIAFTR